MLSPNHAAPSLPLTLAFALAAVLPGCGSGGPTSPSGDGSAASGSPAAPPATTVSPGPGAGAGAADADAIPEAEVRALLDAWLDAQNKGDLAAYLGLYAGRFEGVRRSGDRVARLDRKGWEADRTRMFSKKMVVSIDGVSIATTPSTAQVTLTQTWASGSYKDVGPKRIVLIRENVGPGAGKQAGDEPAAQAGDKPERAAGKGSALRIAREEMLASTLEGVKRLAGHAADEMAFVIQDGGTRVVLDAHPQAGWGEGAPELLADAVPFPTKVAVRAGALPPALAGWAGKKVRLYGPSGPVCEGTLGVPSLVGRVIPHFGEVARWHGTGEHAGEAPLSKGAIARAAWGLAAGARPDGVVLAADLATSQGDCKGALWAQPASAPQARVAKAEEAGAPLAKKAVEALRKLPEYKEIQTGSEGPGPWDERGRTEVVVLRPASGGELLFVSANAVEGCGGFQGNLSAVFEVSGDRLQLAGKPGPVPPEMPAGVVQVGAGRPEILFPERLLRGETGYDQVDALLIPNLDCGC